MVLHSFKFQKNFFLPIVNNSVLFTSYFLHLSLSCCVCVFALLHSSISCHKLFGINLKERKKKSVLTQDKLVKFNKDE